MSLLKLAGVSKENQGEPVLKDIHFLLPHFQKTAIAGETGSGKTTLLKIMAGLVKPDGGEVLFEGARLPGPDEKLIPGHHAIAFLSQHFELRNNYRVEELFEYANNLSLTDAATLYDICRVTHLLKRRTDQLSGGEKQRVAITRLLISSPRLLLLDEPFSNLDMIHKQVMKSVLEDIGEKLKITCLLVSHDPAEILSWADEVLVIGNGEIIQQGSPREVYERPVTEYVAALFGSYNLVSDSLLHCFPSIVPSSNGSAVHFIRPERFRITKSKGKGLKASVENILFYGNFYELSLLVNDQLLKVRSSKGSFARGEQVYVSFST